MAAVDTRPQDGAPAIVLVTITTRVAVYRLASEAVEVPDAAGIGPLQFHPGLLSLRDMEAEVDLFGLESRAFTSARLEFVLPGDASAALTEDAHHAMAAASVDVSLWWPGQDYGARARLVEGGEVTSLSMGRAGEVTEITVEHAPVAVGASAVDPSRDLGETFPKGSGPYPDLIGKAFPVVVGRVYGVPLFRVGLSWMATGDHAGILAGHHLAPNVSVSDLSFYLGSAGSHTFISVAGLTFPQGGTSAPLTSPVLFNGSDPDGHPASWIEVSSSQLTSSEEPRTVDFRAGGVPSVRDSSRAAVGLGEVLEWLLVQSGARVDLHAQRRCTALLAGWEGGVYLDRYDNLLDVIRQRVAPFLPIVEDRSSAGIYYRYADPRNAPIEFALTLGQEMIAPVGAMTLTDLRDVRNSFFLEYGYMHSSGKYAGRLSYGPADLEVCRYSRQVYGSKADKAMRCTITWDEATARRMMQVRAERLALPRRLVTYIIDPSVVSLREGMVGTITDETRFGGARRAVLRRWPVSGTPWRATFELVDRIPTPVG